MPTFLFFTEPLSLKAGAKLSTDGRELLLKFVQEGFDSGKDILA